MMIFLRAAMDSPTRDFSGDSLLLPGEGGGAVAFEQHLDLALRLFQPRRACAGELDPFLERRDRFFQGEPSAFEPLDHPGEARDDVLVLLGDWLCDCVGHGDPFVAPELPGFYSFSSTTSATSSPSCNRTRTRSPGSTCAASSTAWPRGSNTTA